MLRFRALGRNLDTFLSYAEVFGSWLSTILTPMVQTHVHVHMHIQIHTIKEIVLTGK
jgi:hypothetical protein